jgi:hypothetical protein
MALNVLTSNKALVLQNCLEGLVRILRDVSNSSYAPEYDIAGITDPFLHIRVLKLMRTLGQGDADGSEYINDILAQVIFFHLSIYMHCNYSYKYMILYNYKSLIFFLERNYNNIHTTISFMAV